MALSRKTRRFIVAGLIILFLIIAPLLVFYARGYRYSFQRQVFDKVGMMMLAYEPYEATATVDGQKAPFDLTALGYDRFPDLETGTYLVEVFADNYHTWSKKLEVTPEFVTWARYIVLFKTNTSPQEIITKTKINAVGISPDQLWLATADIGNNGPEINIFSTTESDTPPFRISLREYTDKLPPTAVVKDISFAPNSTNILITAENTQDELYFIVVSRENTNDFDPIFLNDYLENIEQAVWHPAGANIVFVQARQELYRLSLTGNVVASKLANQVLGFTPTPDGLYFLRPADNNSNDSEPKASLNKLDRNGKNTQTINSEFELSDKYQISVSEQGKIAVITNTNYLYIYLPTTNKTERVASGITKAIWSQDNDKEDSTDEILLYYNPHEIYIFDPEIFNSDTITRYTEEINNVAWFTENYKYIIFTTANKLKTIELDERDRRNVFDLYETGNDTKIEPGTLFTDRDSKHIYLQLASPANNSITKFTIR